MQLLIIFYTVRVPVYKIKFKNNKKLSIYCLKIELNRILLFTFYNCYFSCQNLLPQILVLYNAICFFFYEIKSNLSFRQKLREFLTNLFWQMARKINLFPNTICANAFLTVYFLLQKYYEILQTDIKLTNKCRTFISNFPCIIYRLFLLMYISYFSQLSTLKF